MRKIRLLLVSLFIGLFLTGCLTVEKKEYKFEFTGKNTGILTITYYNILSTNDSDGVARTDFDELIGSYINGKKPEDDYPNAKLVKKELFEQDGKLCAKVVLSFTDLASVKLYQCTPKDVYMLYLSSLSEYYDTSNGEYGGDVMPVVFWDKKLKSLVVSTTVEKNVENNASLVGFYRQWKR